MIRNLIAMIICFSGGLFLSAGGHKLPGLIVFGLAILNYFCFLNSDR